MNFRFADTKKPTCGGPGHATLPRYDAAGVISLSAVRGELHPHDRLVEQHHIKFWPAGNRRRLQILQPIRTGLTPHVHSSTGRTGRLKSLCGSLLPLWATAILRSKEMAFLL